MDAALAQVLSAKPCKIPSWDFPKQNIVLYGGGRLGKMAYKLLAKAGVSVAYVIDKNAASLAKDFPVPVLTIEQAAQTIGRENYIFDCVFKDTPGLADKMLGPLGFTKIYTVYDLLFSIKSLHFSNGWHSGPLSEEDKQGITYVYEHLADDFSRATYLHNLGWRISRTLPKEGFSYIAEDEKYFNALTRIPRLGNSYFIDAGAFDLFFTLHALDPAFNPFPPAGVIALEPDPGSFAVCEKIRETLPQKRKIQLSPLALSDHAGLFNMLCGNDLASRLVHEDAVTGAESLVPRETTTIDLLTADLPSVGYIKLHVEGEELPCLKGAVACLAKHRPIVSANCAHNRDCLWEIAYFLMKHTVNYRFYFRTYANYGEGLSLYAVPQA